jgi:hypothetical protein
MPEVWGPVVGIGDGWVAVGPGRAVGAAGIGELGAGASEAAGGVLGDETIIGFVAVGMMRIGIGDSGPGEVVRRGARARIGRIGCGEVVLPWWAWPARAWCSRFDATSGGR